jgi:hypothetical protein
VVAAGAWSRGQLHEAARDVAHRTFQVCKDQRGTDAHDAVPAPPEPLIPAPVRRLTAAMHTAVHLHDEPNGLRERVRDVPLTERHLPLERDAQRAAPKRLPQRLRAQASTAPSNRFGGVGAPAGEAEDGDRRGQPEQRSRRTKRAAAVTPATATATAAAWAAATSESRRVGLS